MDDDFAHHSGITLVLPSLRALKAANATKKSKSTVEQPPKIPRPVKLKPLKEVLAKLITQIKKKDDYAFFLRPVDPAQVPGYADMIKQPMDFGTMSVKVAKGKYRSLDEFTTDFRLVTTNAKTFNPPGSIYHVEADRLEVWGLDHIARASAHVIEYETDWNIDVEQDEDGSMSQLVNIEDDVSTPRDVEGSLATGSRAPSVTPAPMQGQAPPLPSGRRGPRGPYKKHAQTAVSDSLDAEGRMPGAKDGVGAFPAGSDWAALMIALKIKGKRYKTKKERLRFEKEGPPYHVDGSLDYAEMEDPFSVLNVLVPEPLSRPQVTPLYPPTSTSTAMSTMTATTPVSTDGVQPPPFQRIYTPTPITVPPDRPMPVLSTLSNTPIPPVTSALPGSALPRPIKKRRHWTILRNVPARARKDKDGDGAGDDTKITWQVPRDPGPADYGTFATLLGDLASASVGMSTAGSGGAAMVAADYMYGSEQRLLATIRSTVVHRGVKRKSPTDQVAVKEEREEGEQEEEDIKEAFWTDAQAEEAWDYVRDVVYGGVDGYAYVRSLAEFVSPSVFHAEVKRDDDDEGLSAPLQDSENTRSLPLGVPLARYVEDNLVDMVTRGRHGWLRDVLFPVGARWGGAISIDTSSSRDQGSVSPFHARLAALPSAARAMAAHRQWSGQQLDIAALLRAPEELAKEYTLEGESGEGEERTEIARALAWSAKMLETLGQRVGGEEDRGGKEWVKKEEEVSISESSLAEKVDADAMDVDATSSGEDVGPGPELDGRDGQEDPLMRRLRLNLLALAKRAPLDQIAKLPVELVPEEIRNIVPIDTA